MSKAAAAIAAPKQSKRGRQVSVGATYATPGDEYYMEPSAAFAKAMPHLLVLMGPVSKWLNTEEVINEANRV